MNDKLTAEDATALNFAKVGDVVTLSLGFSVKVMSGHGCDQCAFGSDWFCTLDMVEGPVICCGPTKMHSFVYFKKVEVDQ